MIFVSGNGTGVGKTHVSCALLLAWRKLGLSPFGIKPIETGIDFRFPETSDAHRLAFASGQPQLASLAGLFRSDIPVAPAALRSPPCFESVLQALRLVQGSPLLIEGAGGPLVPVDSSHYIIDFAKQLHASVLLIANDKLGVLSHTLTAAEAIVSRETELKAVVLNRVNTTSDESQESNLRLLRARLSCPVFPLPHHQKPTELAEIVIKDGLATHLLD